jgi:dihydroorotate dehydrogenase (NAD+) catalytic subunit
MQPSPGARTGKAVKPVAVKCVYDLFTALEIPVIGVGGVSSWEDAVEMIMAGAAAVQVGSAVYDRLDIFSEIGKGIEAFLKRKGYSDIKKITGLAHEMV